MKIGLTYDLREDYNIDRYSEVFADFCHPDEIGYLARAIEANGHEAVMLGNMYKVNDAIKNGTFDCDLVFVEDEGLLSRNREAIVPALLEVNGIPYVGSDAYAMGLTQNKFHTKLVARFLGIRVPDEVYIEYNPEAEDAAIAQWIDREMERKGLTYPMVVKPNAEGYSMGVFLVSSTEEAVEKIRYNFDNYHQEVLLEQFIEGPELYVPLIGTGDEAYCMEVGVSRYEDGRDIDIFSLNDKCFKTILDTIADVTPDMKAELFYWTKLLHRHLGCVDFSRADYKIGKDGLAYFLEVNPRPGLTENGPYETCAKAIGKTYVSVIGEIINSAIKRYPKLADK